MTKIEEIALAIFQKVTSDPEASWDAMSAEERQDALEWARAGLEVARKPTDGMATSGRYAINAEPDTSTDTDDTAANCWDAMIAELLDEGKGRE